ncbi:MAG: zinc ribbon domain-containing protein [Desulfobacterales bacterium]|nr:zinc ribbon domain-containing protein [Desulfobacterales bacterium]
MPIYEYKCEKCDHSFEKLIFGNDKEKIECPECGSNRVKKQMSSGSFMSTPSVGSCSAGAPKNFS